MYYVYIMRDPITHVPFYIGKGSGNRMMVHEAEYKTERARCQNPLKVAAIKRIKDADQFIAYEQIMCESEAVALNLERTLIEQYGRIRNNTGVLTNINEGGAGGKPSEPIYQYNLEGSFLSSFASSKIAAEVIGVTTSAIQNAANLNSSLKSAGGYLWSYEKVEKLDPHVHELHQTVTQFSKTGEEIAAYSTIAEASRTTGVDQGNISACCSKDLKTAGGFVWRLEGELFSLSTHKASMKVQQFDKKTGEFIAEFSSIKVAAEATGVEKSNISRCCSGKLKSAGGFIWKQAA